MSRLLGKMALFGPISTPIWTKYGSVLGPPFGQLGGRIKGKGDFTHHEHDPKIDDFGFFTKKTVFAILAKSRFYEKRRKKEITK